MSFWTRVFGRGATILPADGSGQTASFEPKIPRKTTGFKLNAVDCGDEWPKTWDRLLAPGWALEGHFTMWDVASFVREQRLAYPDAHLFAVLEDVHQAFYTSGHALERDGLANIEPEKTPGLHPASFESFADGEPAEFIGLSHPSEFPIRHAMFMDFVGKSAAGAWQGQLHWSDGKHGCPSIVGGTPERPAISGWEWGWDKRSYVMRVPAKTAAEAIAAFPNGYFYGDLQADQNYHLAKHLDETFDLRIFGLGATYAGYMRDTPLSKSEASALGANLAKLYSKAPDDVAKQIADIVYGQHTFFLSYADR
ncbi:hypothetical protein GCM10011309_15160 [Litorimonas cladophorae]|uniref:Uncharacterized protein n=1 Tax=Litorimonas cladophorae TaxID=1220491 RepID=A0A918KJZ9_9PROT|nr:hypothetical protein [Litorimonas cladophorae]GGX65853.1 hypothetical protein GCM10011309_15160 [Litorimonas cladophorae]